MNRLFVLAILFFLFAFNASAQQPELIAMQGEKGFYIEHKVVAKEGLYSIGRHYNVNPKSIAAFNKMDLNQGISIDQLLQIPLTDTNFTQKGNKGTPVYHIVVSGESLKKIIAAHKKLTLPALQKWNDVKNETLKADSRLIIGFLLSKEIASITINKPLVPAIPKAEVVVTEIVKTETPKEVQQSSKEEMKQPVIEKEKPVEVKEMPVEVKEKAMAVKEEPKKQSTGSSERTDPLAIANSLDYFKPYFDEQVKSNPASKNPTVTGGIFKTNSGWQDGKYYMLIDNVAAGSIIKVMNPDNNKTIYAKVLGEMNGIRQNQGLGVRISAAAASALGIADNEKFIVKLNY